MHKYVKRLYELREELIKFNIDTNESYNIKYIDKWIKRALKEDISPDDFYEELEIDYDCCKVIGDELYHTIAMMRIYC